MAPALMLGGVVPRAPMTTSGSVVKAGDIVFEDISGAPDIKIRDASTGGVTDIASGEEPDVSPDRSRIAFITAADDGRGSSTLHVMNSDGSDIIQLVPRDMNSHDDGLASTIDQWPRWSLDGHWIVFNRIINRGGDGNYWEIDKVRADGTGLSTVTSALQTSSSYEFDVNPAWSPAKDGSDGNYRIAFDSNQGDGTTQLYIVDANGNNLHLAGTSPVPLGAPNWSPDGSRIYFEAGDIYYLSSTDSFTSAHASVSLLQASTNAESLRLSTDGSALVYDDPFRGMYTLSTDGSGSPSLLTGSTDERYPSFVSATWPNASTKNLVGLGDSVAAGEGINYGFIWNNTKRKWIQQGPTSPSWMDTTRAIGNNYPGCHQSGKGYPELLSLDGGNYNVYNMACTGASALQNNGLESGGVLDREILGDGTSPPVQLGGNCTGCDPPSAVFNSHNPAIVTLTLGANDINFANWVITCYTSICDTPTNTQTLNSQLALEKTDLATVLSQLNIWAAGKNKILRVLVTNYYDPMNPNNDTCRDYQVAGIMLLSGSELAWLENGLTNLNANIAAEVRQAQASDTHLSVSIVDLSNIMSGHQWCSSTPWVYGPSIDYNVSHDNPAPYHPTPAGQRAIYMAVKAHL